MAHGLETLPSVANWQARGNGLAKDRAKVLHVPANFAKDVTVWLRGFSSVYGVAAPVVEKTDPDGSCWAVLAERPRACSIPGQAAPTLAGAYRVESRADALHLRSADRDGLLYGLGTAMQLLAAPGALVPGGAGDDAPLFPFRSFQIDLARQPETVATIKKWIIRLALFKMNKLGLYLEDAYDYRSCPGVAPEGALTAKTYRELERFGRQWGVDVYPMMNCYGHMENFLRHPRYAHLSEGRNGPARPWLGDGRHTICASLPEARALLRAQIEEWGDVAAGDFLHVGMDECWNFASCPLCRAKAKKQGDGKVFLDHLLFLYDVAAEAGKRIGFWNDIVYWFPEILKELPRNIVLFDWEYGHVPARRRYCELNHQATDSARWLVEENGLAMVACPATRLENIRSYRRYCDPHKIQGFHFTTWEMSHKLLEECFTGFAYGAEMSWARSPLSMDEFPARLSGIWFGSAAAPVADVVDHALPNYSDQGGDFTAPSALIRHEVTEEAFDAVRPLRRAVAAAEAAEKVITRNGHTLSALQLNLKRTHYTARLTRAVNESVVAMRQLLNQPQATHLPDALNDRVAELRDLCTELKMNLATFARLRKLERGTIPMRHHVGELQGAPAKLDEFIRIVAAFVKNPLQAPLQLGRFWLVIGYAELDANYRRVDIEVSADGKRWKPAVTTRDCGSNAYREVAPLPISKAPRFLKLIVSRVGASAIQNVRIIGWQGEWFPVKVVGCEGKVADPAHLLRDNSQATIFGESDTWLAFHRPEQAEPHSAVILEMAPYRPYPAQMPVVGNA